MANIKVGSQYPDVFLQALMSIDEYWCSMIRSVSANHFITTGDVFNV